MKLNAIYHLNFNIHCLQQMIVTLSCSNDEDNQQYVQSFEPDCIGVNTAQPSPI